MAVLSIDLAHRDYADIGAVVLESTDYGIEGRVLSMGLGAPEPETLADKIDGICSAKGVEVVLLDGPQGWKAENNGLVHSRRCERELNTPGKTGLPQSAKPRTYLGFISFAIATFDALHKRGWRRLDSKESRPSGRILIETFPFSAWRSVGIRPLPSKRRARPRDIEAGLRQLRATFGITVDAEPNHDQLQAIVSGLAGLALCNGDFTTCRFAGEPPRIEGDICREGWIVNRIAG